MRQKNAQAGDGITRLGRFGAVGCSAKPAPPSNSKQNHKTLKAHQKQSPKTTFSYRLRMPQAQPTSEQRKRTNAKNAEQVRLQRLREDAARPMSKNLTEGIALSHQLMQFTGAARPK
jgi:hypothetical protein